MNSQKKETQPSRVKKSALTTTQRWLITACVVLLMMVGAVLGFRALFVQPELPSVHDDPPVSSGGETSSSSEEPPEEVIDYGDGVQPVSSGERKSDQFYTILVMGRDTGGGGQTDTMLLASYDVTNQKATVMSIPRDTMVNVSWDVKKINSVYNQYGQGQKGLKAVYKEISQLVGFTPDYEVVVEWEAIGAIVDAIGGVWFDVPYIMDYHDPFQELVIEQEKGYRFLSGEDAMEVIRWRKNDPDSPYGYTKGIGDAGRIKIQQDFLKAVIQQLLQVENVTKIGQLATVFQENVETDLSFQNILWFGLQAVRGGLSVENVTFVTMPHGYADAYSRYYSKQLGYPWYLSYVVPNGKELLKLVNTSLSPYKKEFKLADLDIMYVNEDGSIGSTTGHVEDAEAALPPPIPEEPEKEPEVDPSTGVMVDPATGEVIPPETGSATPGTGETPSTAPETGDAPAAGTDPETGGEPVTGTDPETDVPVSGENAGTGETTVPETGAVTPPEEGGSNTEQTPASGGTEEPAVPGEPAEPVEPAGSAA